MSLWFSLSPADELSLDECRIALPPFSTCWTFIHRRPFTYECHGYCINETLLPLLPWEQKWRWCHAAPFTSQISWEDAAGCVEWVIMSEGMVPSLCTDWMPTQSPCQPYNIMVENGTLNRFISLFKRSWKSMSYRIFLAWLCWVPLSDSLLFWMSFLTVVEDWNVVGWMHNILVIGW